MPSPSVDPWIRKVEERCERFADKYAFAYNRSEREIAASFEIGCFHALLQFYEASCDVLPQNLTDKNEYRYLTTPNGNPANFSFVKITHPDGIFTLRQQVRIRSYLDPDIAFTPDMVILKELAEIEATKDKDYAKGKRSFFIVSSSAVIAAHECKSMNPFPELLVSFIGHLLTAHKWIVSDDVSQLTVPNGIHLAPTLFVGGTARALHLRMIKALEKCYPINILVGMHSGNWKLLNPTNQLVRLVANPMPDKGDIAGTITE